MKNIKKRLDRFFALKFEVASTKLNEFRQVIVSRYSSRFAYAFANALVPIIEWMVYMEFKFRQSEIRDFNEEDEKFLLELDKLDD